MEQGGSTAIGQDSALPAVSARLILGHGAIRMLFMKSCQVDSSWIRGFFGVAVGENRAKSTCFQSFFHFLPTPSLLQLNEAQRY